MMKTMQEIKNILNYLQLFKGNIATVIKLLLIFCLFPSNSSLRINIKLFNLKLRKYKFNNHLFTPNNKNKQKKCIIKTQHPL